MSLVSQTYKMSSVSQIYRKLFVSQIYKMLFVSRIYKMSFLSQIYNMLFLSQIYEIFGLRILDFVWFDIFNGKEVNVSVYVIRYFSKCTKTYEHVAALKSQCN